MQNTLYSKHASIFSATRSAPWKGWLELSNKEIIKRDKAYSVLDIGCGNGRFLKYLSENGIVESYLGIDYSTELLEQAKEVGGQYLNVDIDNTDWQVNDSQYNLVVGFGIQHHLTTFQNRLHFLKNIKKALQPDGIAIVTYWQFLDFERYKNKIEELEGENNYSMSFANEANARFCHFTNLAEIELLEQSSGLKLLDTFKADGRDNTENIYRVYSK